MLLRSLNVVVIFIIVKLRYVVKKGIIMGIKTGRKPIAETTGKEDKRQRVTPGNKKKHPDLKEHDHKKGD